jgi:hypothetical protein
MENQVGRSHLSEPKLVWTAAPLRTFPHQHCNVKSDYSIYCRFPMRCFFLNGTRPFGKGIRERSAVTYRVQEPRRADLWPDQRRLCKMSPAMTNLLQEISLGA